MIDLLILADDFTGALDSSVQLAAEGIPTQVRLDSAVDLRIPQEVRVLAVNLNTRHLPKSEASARVRQWACAVAKAGVPYFYKKTDSTLRGNVGSELDAMLSALGSQTLVFVPAFPAVGRTTCDGIQYCDGVPLEQSSVRNDPRCPMTTGDIRAILAQQTSIPVRCLAAGAPFADGDRPQIIVYDAASDADLHATAKTLLQRGVPRAMAGSGGFAAMLPELLHLRPMQSSIPVPAGQGTLIVSCSVNAAALEQLRTAQQSGMSLFTSPPQIADAAFLRSTEANNLVNQVSAAIHTQKIAALCCAASKEDRDATWHYAKTHGLEQEMADTIVHNMADIVRCVFRESTIDTLIVFGGDTLCALMDALHCNTLQPYRQPFPGVVCSVAMVSGRPVTTISKAGGFGQPELLQQIIMDLEMHKGGASNAY